MRGSSTRRPAPTLSPEAVRQWLAGSCAEQGIDVKVRDPVVLAQVAVMLGAGREPDRSSSPDGLHPRRVKARVATVGRMDLDALDQGLDDGPLTGEGEAGPLAS